MAIYTIETPDDGLIIATSNLNKALDLVPYLQESEAQAIRAEVKAKRKEYTSFTVQINPKQDREYYDSTWLNVWEA